jgi:CheY-like chemotaxis protein
MSRSNNRILLAEDSEDDEIIFRRTLLKAGIKNPLTVFHSAFEAMAWLKIHTRPSVVFVDLCMPGLDGTDLLEWMATQPRLEKCLFVVLTGVDTSRCVKRAYQLGAHSFLTKPVSEADIANLVKHFSGHWTLKANRSRRSIKL